MNQRILTVFVVMTLVMLFAGGCASSNGRQGDMPGGIVTYSSSTSLGRVNESETLTVFSYALSITNETGSSFRLTSVEPLIDEEIRARLVDGKTVTKLDIPLRAGETAEADGQIIIDTGTMTKEEIILLTDRITDYRLETEILLKVKGR